MLHPRTKLSINNYKTIFFLNQKTAIDEKHIGNVSKLDSENETN